MVSRPSPFQSPASGVALDGPYVKTMSAPPGLFVFFRKNAAVDGL